VAVLSTAGIGLALAGMADATSANAVRRFRGAGAIALALAILAVIPAVFVDARVRHDLKLLTELLEQTRLGEASELVRGIAALQPSTDWQGRPIAALRRDLDQTVADLRSRLAVALPDSAGPLARVDRARDLAILGDTVAALKVLRDRRIATIEDPEVMNLLGTIHETRSEWTAAGDWYRRARRASEDLPASETRQTLRLQAQRGIAYAERKAGRTPEAEAAYRELLALSPTADAHFLLAQFYEDAQQTDLAHQHVRHAMSLDPRRYGKPGRELIDKLQTVHFGCFGTFQAERSSGGTGRGP
jgi:tetratricopeptide (TPR) repeat protein